MDRFLTARPSNAIRIFLLQLLLTFSLILGTFSRSIAQNAVETNRPAAASPPSRLWLSSNAAGAAMWEPPPPRIETVHVIDWNEREVIAVDPATSTTKKFNALQVQAIEVNWTSESAWRAHRAFEKGDFASAIDLAKSSISLNDVPRWQQKILAMHIVDSLVALKQFGAAGRLFISLSKESLPPTLLASMPLNWMNDRPDALLVEQAEQWMATTDSDTALLLGASWLLNGTDPAKAQASLEALARKPSSIRGMFAASQLWRIATPAEVSANVASWRSARDSMLPCLQLGPTITIAFKLERVGLKQASLAEWLRAAQFAPAHPALGKRAIEQQQSLLQELYPKSSTVTETRR